MEKNGVREAPPYDHMGPDRAGNKRTIVADIDWTFPLDFVEVVWGDGKRVDRQIISATDLPAFGRHFSEKTGSEGSSFSIVP